MSRTRAMSVRLGPNVAWVRKRAASASVIAATGGVGGVGVIGVLLRPPPAAAAGGDHESQRQAECARADAGHAWPESRDACAHG
jgi:hypothetical protein